MASTYPVAAKSFTVKTDGAGQTIFAAHVNDLQDEVVAVENALLNGFTHALKPSVASAQDLGSASLPWGKARLGGLQLTAATTLTLATDAATVTQSYHALDTEGAAGTDNCATLTAGTGVADGFVLVVRAANVAHVVTLQDGVGNLLLNGSCTLSTTDATISLIYDGTNWREIARSIPLSNILDRQVATQNVASTTAETTVYTKQIDANTLSTNRTIKFSTIGDFLNNTGSTVTMTVKVKYGGTTIFTAVLTNVNTSANRGSLNLEGEITALNATNAQVAKVVLTLNGTSGNNAGGTAKTVDLVGGAAVATGQYMEATQNTLAEDSTANKNFVITYQPSASSASYSMRLHTVYVELK